MSSAIAIAIVNRQAIIDRVAEGEMLDQIALELGIQAPAISRHLANDPEYRQAREIGAELRLHRSRSAIAEIADMGKDESGAIVGLSKAVGNLARVREARLRADQWFAEREFGERWGAKQQVTINQGVSVEQALGDLAHALLDRMRVVASVDAGIEAETVVSEQQAALKVL